MFIKSVEWISKEIYEAEVIVSDGYNELLCFSQPLYGKVGDVLINSLYNQQVANGKTPSILTANPNNLLEESRNTQNTFYPPNRRVFDFDRPIGKFWDTETRRFYETTRATIHYNNKGQAHIVPARPNELLNR